MIWTPLQLCVHLGVAPEAVLLAKHNTVSWKASREDMANLQNRYSALCWRPVTHVQTWASYSALYGSEDFRRIQPCHRRFLHWTTTITPSRPSTVIAQDHRRPCLPRCRCESLEDATTRDHVIAVTADFQACTEDGTVSQIVRQRTLAETAAMTLV